MAHWVPTTPLPSPPTSTTLRVPTTPPPLPLAEFWNLLKQRNEQPWLEDPQLREQGDRIWARAVDDAHAQWYARQRVTPEPMNWDQIRRDVRTSWRLRMSLLNQGSDQVPSGLTPAPLLPSTTASAVDVTSAVDVRTSLSQDRLRAPPGTPRSPGTPAGPPPSGPSVPLNPGRRLALSGTPSGAFLGTPSGPPPRTPGLPSNQGKRRKLSDTPHTPTEYVRTSCSPSPSPSPSTSASDWGPLRGPLWEPPPVTCRCWNPICCCRSLAEQ